MFKNSDERAFTLIEMLLVIGIISIVGAMVVPSLGQSLNRTRTERYARSLQQAFEAAQLKAVTLKRCYRVKFEITNGSPVTVARYSRRSCRESGGSWESISGLAPFTFPRKVEVYSAGNGSGADQYSGEVCVYFSPRGRISNIFDCSNGNQSGDTQRGPPIIHLGTTGFDFSDPDPCEYATVYTEYWTKITQPEYVSYGAFDEFSARPGDDPC